MIKYLAHMKNYDRENAVADYGWPEVTDAENILRDSITRQMSTTSTSMKIIQNFLGLLMSEAPP